MSSKMGILGEDAHQNDHFSDLLRKNLEKEPQLVADLCHEILKSTPKHAEALKALYDITYKTQNTKGLIQVADYFEKAGLDSGPIFSDALLVSQGLCDWTHRCEIINKLKNRCAQSIPFLLEPMSVLAAVDDPNFHKSMAVCLREFILKNTQLMPKHAQKPMSSKSRHEKIRIGYLSGDFNFHPMTILIAGIIESHDRDHFEIYGFDYSKNDETLYRKRICKAFDHLIVLGNRGPMACAQLIVDHKIDILIDLKGYTKAARPDIFALRPAPVQVAFLGFPSTTAAPWIDYVIADKCVIPESETSAWTESIAYMPHSYYPGDRLRPIPVPPTKEEKLKLNLPSDAFVFGCFNAPYKITPEVFNLWMQILQQTPSSVLWLYDKIGAATSRLRQEAAKQGIDRDRLIFADYAPPDKHIKRHAYMDLFLDTSPYNAHTTATDALWAGVPLITLRGHSFASRVGFSLLKTLGLEELIAQDPDDYVKKAVAFAKQSERLAKLKAFLISARETSSLYDITQYTRNLEKLYSRMAEISSKRDTRPQSLCAEL